MVLFSPLTAFTEKMLDVTTLRHRVIANNIANLNSPNFKRSEVSFTDALEQIKNSAEETTPELTEEMRVPGINQQLLSHLTIDNLYAEGQQYESDLGVGYSLSNTAFSQAYDRSKAGTPDVESLDPRAQSGKAMSRADFIAGVQPEIVKIDDSQRQDGNNINPEIEMASMIKNTSFYNVLVSSISGDFRTLKTIISNR
ncbi:MAG: flagellar basal body rod protein FlgB [Candidatus Sericytochromatia bacterium]